MMNSILVWNCQGVGGRSTLRHFQEMIKMYKISMVALLETRVQSNNFVLTFHSEVMKDMIIVEAQGFAGRIWLMCNRQDVEVEEISLNDRILNVMGTKSLVLTILCLCFTKYSHYSGVVEVYSSPRGVC